MSTTPLAAYMKQAGITDAQFAACIGRDRSIVTKIKLGRIRPSIDTAVAIERETKGAIPVHAWVAAA